MASNNNNNNNNNGTEPSSNRRGWLSSTQRELDDANSPLGILTGKPLSCFNTLTRNYVQDPKKFQVNLGQFP
jgi:hypothetical protein